MGCPTSDLDVVTLPKLLGLEREQEYGGVDDVD